MYPTVLFSGIDVYQLVFFVCNIVFDHVLIVSQGNPFDKANTVCDSRNMGKKKSWLNAATSVTLVRFALIPVIVLFYFLGHFDVLISGKLIAMILFIVAAFTDFLDGWIARKFNQITDLGKLLDPIADKTLTFVGFVLIFTDTNLLGVYNLYPVWFAFIIFFIATFRDFITNALRQFAALKNHVIAADIYAKIKSFLQFIGISLAMFYAFYIVGLENFGGTFESILRWATWIFLSASAVLSIMSGISYVTQFVKLSRRPKQQPNPE
jgi:CDP-diacylglycerol--glycerol-3-phosphate 3-phosphatidyltransferase